MELDWNRDQCATVAQLRTGHSPLLAGYLHRIGRRDSATCPHCNGADETAEHLVLRCPVMTRSEETSGWEDYSTRIHDASGSSWSGLGRWPPPRPGMTERDRTGMSSATAWRCQQNSPFIRVWFTGIVSCTEWVCVSVWDSGLTCTNVFLSVYSSLIQLSPLMPACLHPCGIMNVCVYVCGTSLCVWCTSVCMCVVYICMSVYVHCTRVVP